MAILTEVTSLLDAYISETDLSYPTALEQEFRQQSLIPDSDGRMPGTPEYAETVDVYYNALLYAEYFAGLPAITSATSEGTSLSVTPPDWDRLIRFLKSKSPIVGASNQLWTVVPVDNRHIHRTWMNDRGDPYGDVDTDIG